MSFQKYLIFQFCLVAFMGLSKNVEGVIEKNPFFQGRDELGKKCLKPNGQFPSNSCNKYVNCWKGIAIEQTCPNGLLFSPIKLQCDFPENVDCQGKLIIIAPQAASVPQTVSLSESSTSTSSGSNPALRKFCLKSGGLFSGSTCDKFVNCWDNNVVEMDCPTGLYFNPEGYCDYPENVFCERPGDNDKKTDAQTKDSDCPLETGMFRNRSDCSHYYACLRNKVVARYACAEGFSFSDVLGVCDYSSRVDCSKEPQIYQKQATNTPDVQIKDSDCPLETGMFRNRSDCSHYYACLFNKVVVRYKCAEGFSFSDVLGVCDYSSRVDCSKEPQIYQKQATNTPDEQTKDSDCPLETGMFRNRSDCSHYYACLSNKVVARYVCAEGFSFSDVLGVCDYSSRVDCSKEPQIYQKQATNTPATNDNPCAGINGLVRDKQNCSSYYLCDHGTISANYICPIGFKFSNEIGVCDYEDKVNCNQPLKPFGMTYSMASGLNLPKDIISKAQNCVPGSVFRLNPECTIACRCREGGAEIIECSLGLAYDSKLDKCVLAHLAKWMLLGLSHLRSALDMQTLMGFSATQPKERDNSNTILNMITGR